MLEVQHYFESVPLKMYTNEILFVCIVYGDMNLCFTILADMNDEFKAQKTKESLQMLPMSTYF